MATKKSWEKLIADATHKGDLKGRTCQIYNQNVPSSLPNLNGKCKCGRLVNRHSFSDVRQQTDVDNHGEHTVVSRADSSSSKPPAIPVTIYGTLKFTGCKYIRLDKRLDVKHIYQLLVDDCGGQRPALILSVFGGAKHFTMTEKVEKEIIQSIIDAAATVDAWILTTGINNGVSKLVGEGVTRYRLLKEDPDKIKCIGLTMWGTINESTRFELKYSTKGYPSSLRRRQIPDSAEEDDESIERNHTHCILFDNGKLSDYLGDDRRNDLVEQARQDKNADHTCYAVTIIVNGGTHTTKVIKNDIAARRPIILIEHSGRLADVLVSLLKQISDSNGNQQSDPQDEDVEKALKEYFPSLTSLDMPRIIRDIQDILTLETRHLLNVFSLNRDKTMAETIFNAIFTQIKKETANDNTKHKEEFSKEGKDRREEHRLLNLALQWNFADAGLQILKERHAMNKDAEAYEDDVQFYKKLFRQSLLMNRPAFAEYFLANGFDLCSLINIDHSEQYEKDLLELYNDALKKTNKTRAKCIKLLFNPSPIKRIQTLDKKLNKSVGAFIGNIYSPKESSFLNRISIDLTNRVCTCCSSETNCFDSPVKQSDQSSKEEMQPIDLQNKNKFSSKDKVLRDLFLWCVFMDMPDMAKIFLFHQQSRICAALIASAIFKQYANSSLDIYHKEKFQNQALDFETYAAEFINICYHYNERLASELLLRQVPLFGNVTCMQVAISSESKKLVGTPCFDQTLTQVWYNKLSTKSHQTHRKLLLLLAILTFGLIPYGIIDFREKDTDTEDTPLSSKGMDYYINKESSELSYCTRFVYFHQSPLIKMCYHFISYIFFILVFSYMMLYHLDSPATFTIPHWTEIYVIITVSTMFCEEIRKLHREYRKRMLEQWGDTGSVILTVLTNIFYIVPYLMFYLGLAFRYRGYDDNILTTARIIWAFDLELWYLNSLKYVVALKSVGPKLFMLKNMLRDLAGFVYMIFIAIAAYGVVSRALIFYKQIPFTGSDIFREIFYEPYWFIYGSVSDKDLLDEKIKNDTASVVAEATATHILLAFHMLFINILILNLLIAVFAYTIDKVQENTEFYWRYQRYSFIREYYEQPPFAYPPLIFVPHLILACLALKRKCHSKQRQNQVSDTNQFRDTNQSLESKRELRVFKMIPVDARQQNERWDAFENVATHSYARSLIQKNDKNDVSAQDDIQSKKATNTIESNVVESISDQQQNITQLNKQMRDHNQQATDALQWMINAMARVKMNGSNEEVPKLKRSFETVDAGTSMGDDIL